ncbi:MAG TPA: hypothetical protein VKD72_34260, partial [Gemmataceae bacterium]|nr:hypothetical protein [Gemmataceae bacterium]
MGRIDIVDAVKTAQRFADASQRQATTRDNISDAKGLDRRRDFMHASGRVFFESVIEGSDLFPMRYLGVGQLAARAVGRIHLPPSDGYGDGYATGFLVAPNVLLTNQHVLRTIDW